MAELLTIKNESMVSVPDGVNPLIDPLGPKPTATSLSPGAAAVAAGAAATVENKNILGIFAEGDSAKNLLFLGIVGFLIWKYGRSIVNA